MWPRRTKRPGVEVGMNRGNSGLGKEKEKGRDETEVRLPPLTNEWCSIPGKERQQPVELACLYALQQIQFGVGLWAGRGTEASWKSRNAG